MKLQRILDQFFQLDDNQSEIVPIFYIIISHVMKTSTILLFIILSILARCSLYQQTGESEQEIIAQLQQQLQSLDASFIEHFINFYHETTEQMNFIDKKSILNITRVSMKQSMYLVLVAKMYLYGLLPNHNYPELESYDTKSNYMAAYYYLRVAAQYYQNKEAYYLLGILQHFKLVPDKLLESNIEAKMEKTQNQVLLLKFLEQSHLYNAESNLFMSSALGYHPASLILGYMNKLRLGTSKNCTAALAYYLSVVKGTYIDQFYFRQLYDIDDSLEDLLYSRKRISQQKHKLDNHFIEETDYYDEEIIEATKELADSFYMGTDGHLRNTTKAVKLYQKLAQGGNNHGKVMAGICYFKGEGVPVNRVKAYNYFAETTSKSQIAEYMLLAMKYFQILQKGSKQKALASMLQKYKNYKKSKDRMSHHISYLIGSVIIKGELKEKDKDGKEVVIAESQGYQLLDVAAVNGNTYAKVMLGILFADGVNGLKYGCQEAVKYFSEEALTFPFFKDRVSTAQGALKRGQIFFPLIKYMQLALIGYQNAYINLLYLLQVYEQSVLNMRDASWSIANFKNSQIYKELKQFGLVDVESFILKRFTIKGKAALNFNNMQNYLIANKKSISSYHSYMRRKTIKWGSIFDRKNMLKYYDYKLTLQQNGNYLPLLTGLASGDSSKLYVSEARYLLGKHHHEKALQNKTTLTASEHFRILGQYNRAVKSQIAGLIIFHIEEYLLGKGTSFDFFQSEIGQDLLAYIFVLSICLFILYYMRSKRIDQFHKNQLEKQLRKSAEQNIEQEQAEGSKMAQESVPSQETIVEEVQKLDNSQPIITEDQPNQPKGVRIGSSYE